MFERIVCALFSHKYIVQMRFSSTSRKVGCTRCNMSWGMNDDARALIPWDQELEDVYKILGQWPQGTQMKKISYFLNYMGPVNADWIAKHGSQWAMGRIDVFGVRDSYNNEITVSPMHTSDWTSFGSWLIQFETDTVWTLEQLASEYEKTHPKILWLYGEPYGELENG
jgi:hypothetical protein